MQLVGFKYYIKKSQEIKVGFIACTHIHTQNEAQQRMTQLCLLLLLNSLHITLYGTEVKRLPGDTFIDVQHIITSGLKVGSCIITG